MKYIWLIIVASIPLVRNEWNLYHTDESRTTHYYYDCFRYYVPVPYRPYLREFPSPLEIIPYCLRPVDGQIDSEEFMDGNWTSYRFDELRMKNVTTQDLIDWSVPFDKIEDYQQYLYAPSVILGRQILNTCPSEWFGLRCQYTLNYWIEFNAYGTDLFKSKEELIKREISPFQSTHHICYTLLNCNRCLDWREICDGKVDCEVDSMDERNCLELEMNECTDEEYRCHNGMCIPDVFFNDNPYSADCLDGTDEQGIGTLLERSDGYKNCFRDPGFRCEEAHHLLGQMSFPCGDGQMSVVFQRCSNARHILHFEPLFSFEQNQVLTFHCWSVFYCAVGLYRRQSDQCKRFCSGFQCVYNLSAFCHSTYVFFPHKAILHDHIRFAYWTNRTIHRGYYSEHILPHYICYDAERCPFLTPTLYINGSACSFPHELQVTRLFQIDQLFRACTSESIEENSIKINTRYHFRCPGTTKFISKHRLLDGIVDCHNATDETDVDTCSFGDKYRFQCSSEKKCISPAAVRDTKPD